MFNLFCQFFSNPPKAETSRIVSFDPIRPANKKDIIFRFALRLSMPRRALLFARCEDQTGFHYPEHTILAKMLFVCLMLFARHYFLPPRFFSGRCQARTLFAPTASAFFRRNPRFFPV